MAQFRNIFDIDLQRGRKEPFPLMQPVGEGDAKGIRVGARVTNNGADVDLGGQCVGKVIRANGSDVPLTGTISGNQAYVTLDQASCAIVGPIQVAVMWVSGTIITTLIIAYGTVVKTATGNTVQPSTPIPDLTQLLAEIDAMRQATAAAEAAATKAVRYDTDQSLTNEQKKTARDNINAARIAIISGAFDTTQDYYVGDYCTYNGSLYRFTADHPAGAWKGNDTSPDVTAVTVGNEINYTTVKVNRAQSLNGTQKAQARANIDAAAIGTFAVAFNPNRSEPYNPGDYCTYSGSLYRFTTTHTGAWNNSHVVAVTVGNEINTTTVKTNVSQSLSNDQKTRARTNIGAASAGDVDDLKSAFPSITGNSIIALLPGYIKTNDTTANINNVVAHAHYYHGVVECQAGDRFTINAQGGSTPRSWAFIDNSGNVLANSDDGVAVYNTIITAPTDSAYLVINDFDGVHQSFIGVLINDRVKQIGDTLSGSAIAFTGRAAKTEIFNYLFVKGAKYRFTNKTSGTVSVFAYNGDGTREQIAASLASNAYIEFSAMSDYVGIGGYFNAAGSVTLETISIYDGLNVVDKISEQDVNYDCLGKAYITKSNGVYGIVASTSCVLYGICIKGGQTYTINTKVPSYSNQNRISIVILNTVPNQKDLRSINIGNIIADSGIETSHALEYASYTINAPVNARYIIIADYISDSVPYIEEKPVTQNGTLKYEDFLKYAETQGLSVSNKIIGRGTATTCVVTLYTTEINPIRIKYKCSASGTPPYITVYRDNTYNNIRLDMSATSDFDVKELRIPPIDCSKSKYCMLSLAIPIGAEVSFIEAIQEKSLLRKQRLTGISINSHLGYSALCPENTIPAFVASVRCGYDAIITTPQKTSDGKWVCMHDATINRTGRNEDGTTISSKMNVSDLTFSQLQEYDFGVYYNAIFAGTKIPSLDDFLLICASNNTVPIFSLHNSSYSIEDIESLKSIVKKHGLLNHLVLKLPTVSAIEAFYSVFGGIGLYDFVAGEFSQNIIDSIVACNVYGNCDMMVDYPATAISEETVRNTLSANLACGVFDLQARTLSNYRTWIGYGVTVFTDDKFCVNGLNWC